MNSNSSTTALAPALRSRADSLRQWLLPLKRRWFVLLGWGVLGMGAGSLWAATRPVRYEAAATLEYDVGLGTARLLGDPMAQGSELSYRTQRELIETQNFVLRSRTLAERVVRQLGLDIGSARDASATERKATFDRAVARLQAAIELESVPNTRIVTVRAQASTAQNAVRIANGLVDAYLQKSLEDRVATTSRALEWLSSEQNKLAGEAEASELAVFKYREDRQTLFASLDERRKLTAQQLESYTTALTELRIKRIQTQARATVLKEALAASQDPMAVQAGPIASDPAVQALRERTRNLESELQQLGLSESPDAQKMLGLRAARDTALAQLTLQLENVLKGAQAELKEVDRAETGLEQALSAVQQQIEALSREEIELAALERERKSHAERYSQVLARTAQVDLGRALNASTARVIDRATAVGEPGARNMGLGASLGAAVGLLLGGLWVALVRPRGVGTAGEEQAL